MWAELADLARQTPSFSGLWSLHMRTDTRIRLAICSRMLACAGTLSVPVTAYAEGDAASGEKIFAHCAPAIRPSRVKTRLDRRWPASSAARAGGSPGIAIRRQSRD